MHVEPGCPCYLRSLKPTGSFSHLEKRATLCAAGNHGDYTHVNPAHIELENKCYWTLNLSEEISPFVYKATSESQLARRVFWLIKGCDVSNTGKWSHQRKLLLPSVLCLQTQRTPLLCVTPGPIHMVLFSCRRLREKSGLALMDSVLTP